MPMIMVPEERNLTERDLTEQIDAALGRGPADLWLRNVRILDVYTETVFEGSVLVKNGRIVALNPEFDPQVSQAVDGQGHYLIPGFLDACTHIDCSLVMPDALASGYVPFGTTTVVAEVNDLAAVLGEGCVAGIKAYFKDREKLPYRLLGLAPAKNIKLGYTMELLDWEGISGQGESYGPTTLAAHPDTIAKAVNVRKKQIFLNGDVEPFSSSDEIGAFAVCGSVNDHEAWTYEAVFQRHRRGIPTQILYEQGEAQLRFMIQELILGRKLPCENFMFAGDNTYINDMIEGGILNRLVNWSIQLGLSPIKAIKMASFYPAQNLGLTNLLGSITPGRFADFILTDSLSEIHPLQVYKGGVLVAEQGRLLHSPRFSYPELRMEFPSDLSDFSMEALEAAFREPDAPRDAQGRCQVDIMSLNLDGRDRPNAKQVLQTGCCILPAWLPLHNGTVQSDPEQDTVRLLKVGRRSGRAGRTIGHMYVKGMGFRNCALAMTNLAGGDVVLVAGDRAEDMYAALQEAGRHSGAIVLASGGTVEAVFDLPYGGMISDLSAQEAMDQLHQILDPLERRGCRVPQLLTHFWMFAFACADGQPV